MAKVSSFFSPYHLDGHYWIMLNGPNAVLLSDLGGRTLYHNPELYGVRVESPWVSHWEALIRDHVPEIVSPDMQSAVMLADTVPTLQEIELALRPTQEINHIAEHLWFADHLTQHQLVCFLQPVVDRAQQEVGYEAFVRMEATNGLLTGATIMQASRALHIEYQVDRVMHKKAIESFAQVGLGGHIFINFLTGFIHRPEVYLDGLNQSVAEYGLTPPQVVLDISLADYAKHIEQLASIAEYCHARGFLLALDDVASADGLAAMLTYIQPAFVKLAPSISYTINEPGQEESLKNLVAIAHRAEAKVLAEGVENEALFSRYKEAGVDQFQGYYFGSPQRSLVAASTKKLHG